MSWVSLTAENIKGRLAKDELDAYLAAGDQEQDGISTLSEIIDQVTAMVRGKVSSNRDNLAKMGSAGTIPLECMFAACTIAREALVGSLPLSEGSTEVRKEELRAAYAFLDAVAKGDIRIESASGDYPENDTSTTGAASYGGTAYMEF